MRKLTDSDKKEILKLYRETAETTSTLAERYEVSNSTISRLLKSTLPEDEYEYLVSLKRAARTPEGRAQVSYDNIPVFSSHEKEEQPEKVTSPTPVAKKVVEVKPKVVIQREEAQRAQEVDEDISSSPRRVRKRSSAGDEKPIPRVVKKPVPVAEQLELLEEKPSEIPEIRRPLIEHPHPDTDVLAEMFGEDLLGESEDLEDLDDEDLDLDEDDEEYYDEDEFEISPPLVTRPRSGDALVRVLPLSAANLPKTCYLVIDRSSELITRPLKDFGDLGHIPNLETQQRTLPVFDNHRVAKRFSTKRDRVIKVPDTKMLHKARNHLQAKGITRLLIDGQVYSLSPAPV
ncbi:MAG: transposase [Scytonema sp. PMC 1069.18]|nr:transposase [Scytonema sp. PMC 1069.18]MEC4885504.1 transposase [Scytonema sp. PMC 1070.18]